MHRFDDRLDLRFSEAAGRRRRVAATLMGILTAFPAVMLGQAGGTHAAVQLDEWRAEAGRAAGNMRSIRDRADRVRELDPRYAAFAAQLQTLADGYQSSAITTMIERYSNGGNGPGS